MISTKTGLICGLAFASNCLFAGTMSSVEDVHHLYLRADVNYGFFVQPKQTMTASLELAPEYATLSKVNNNVGYNGGFGYRFHSNFRADINFTYRPSIAFKVADSVPQIGTGSFNNYTLMANGYYDFPITFIMTPYVSAGFGVSSNSTKSIYWPYTQQNEYGQVNQTVVWQVGAGLTYPLYQNLLIDFNYQYINLGNFTNSGHYDKKGIPNPDEPTLGAQTMFRALYSNQIQVGLRYYV